MSDATEIISKALASDMETMRLLALNVANAQTPGYKRIVPVSRSYASEADALTEGATLQSVSPQLQAVVDPTAGTLRSTGRSLDLALEGDGFFVVATTHDMALRRRGDFVLDALGYLATASGERLQGARGALLVGEQKLQISTNGDVRAGEQLLDRLQIVQVTAPASLREQAPGLWEWPAEGVRDMSAYTVRQGFLEASNVQSVNEMVRVMETLRHFESAQRYFRTTDDLMQKAISELGKTGN
jgi:flagellar basal-body rod protein FlgF